MMAADTRVLMTSSSAAKNIPEGARLQRGMSKATINLPLVVQARSLMVKDRVPGNGDDDGQYFIESPEATFVLPDISLYPEDFKAFLHKDLIETSTLVSLEQGGHLNWWADIGVGRRLLPLVTSGDGNCLLHAASLGMWGFHDRLLTLRKALCNTISRGPDCESFRRRWRWQQTLTNRQCGLILSEDEWKQEWNYLLKLASPQPRGSPKPPTRSGDRPYAGQSEDTEVIYESLEELHVFVLAHVLRRPIIVVAKTMLKDMNGEALAPIPFGGIYLPLELNPKECHRSPLLLTYDVAHFCALVWMDVPLSEDDRSSNNDPVIPLVNPELDLLPIHFSVDPGLNFDWQICDDFEMPALSIQDQLEMLKDYMDIQQVPIGGQYLEFDPFREDMRPRTSSWGGNKSNLVRSDSDGGGFKDRPKVLKDSEKKVKVSKQFQNVVTSFGSLGQSVSKKLKNIGKNGKSGSQLRKKSIGSVTQCTRTSSLTVEKLQDRSQILCTRLRCQPMFFQDKLVKNYLSEAKERFDKQNNIRRQQCDEMQHRTVELRRTQTVSVRPITYNNTIQRNVEGTGLPSINSTTQQNRFSYGPSTTARDMPQMQRQNTLFVAGKSKFYTTCSEEHSLTPEVNPTKSPPNKHSATVPDVNILSKKMIHYNPLDTLDLKKYEDSMTGSSLQLPNGGQRSSSDLKSRPTRSTTDSQLPSLPNPIAVRNSYVNSEISSTRNQSGSAKSAVPKSSTLPTSCSLPESMAQSVKQGDYKRAPGSYLYRDGNGNLSSVGSVRPLYKETSSTSLVRDAGSKPLGKDTGGSTPLVRESGSTLINTGSAKCAKEGCRNRCMNSTQRLCTSCFQTARYSSLVQYPTAQTKF